MTARRWLAGVVCAALGVSLMAAADAPEDRAAFDPSPTSLQERRLIQGLLDIREGRLDEALANVSYLVAEQPDFRLAHLVHGDLLLAMAGRPGGFGGRAPGDVTYEYRQEAIARLERYLDSPPASAVPDSLIRMPESVASALLVDLESYRLFLIENRGGEPRRSRDFYVSIGKGGSDKQREGDEKTPVGVYRVVSYIPGSRLPDLYGVGAFPLDYPNAWDRLRGRTGSGIWIHGTESEYYSRPPRSSLGCVTLSNDDFRLLERYVSLEETPVLVARSLGWSSPGQVRSRRREFERQVETWRSDWESRDPERYLSHYSSAFRMPGMSRAAFAAHKRRVNPSKRYIRVRLDDLGIYAYPGEPNLVLVEFVQRYESDNFRSTASKRQFWRREGEGWKIVLEQKI